MNIAPVFYHQMPNGNYRYFAGVFNNARNAKNAKNVIVSGGITDAFVVALYRGERISIERAALLQAEGASQPPQQELSLPAGSMQRLIQPVINPEDIEFRVQIGAYSNEVPIDVIDLLISVSNTGIKKYNSEQGLTAYTAGSFKNYNEAENLKNSIVNEGIPDAFVVAFSNDRRISIQEATEVINSQ